MDEGVGAEAMDVDAFLVDELMTASLNQVYTGPDLRTVSKEVDRSFTLSFCGARITCVVPKTAVSETSGEHLEPPCCLKSVLWSLVMLPSCVRIARDQK